MISPLVLYFDDFSARLLERLRQLPEEAQAAYIEVWKRKAPFAPTSVLISRIKLAAFAFGKTRPIE